MGVLTLERTTLATPEQLWQVVTDWSGYARWMPLTTMRLDDGPTRVGWSFAGLSGVGPLRFADVMVITSWEPPREGRARFRLRKIGRLLDGWADVSVEPGVGGRRPPAGEGGRPGEPVDVRPGRGRHGRGGRGPGGEPP
jgi:uncharacterized protein YndB with AHSA1/START domain